MIAASQAPVLGFALGGQELIIIFILVLLLFGAKKLPELARGMGKSMGEFRKAKEEFEHEITRAQDEAEKEWEEDKDEKQPAEPAAEEEEIADVNKTEAADNGEGSGADSDSAPKES